MNCPSNRSNEAPSAPRMGARLALMAVLAGLPACSNQSPQSPQAPLACGFVEQGGSVDPVRTHMVESIKTRVKERIDENPQWINRATSPSELQTSLEMGLKDIIASFDICRLDSAPVTIDTRTYRDMTGKPQTLEITLSNKGLKVAVPGAQNPSSSPASSAKIEVKVTTP